MKEPDKLTKAPRKHSHQESGLLGARTNCLRGCSQLPAATFVRRRRLPARTEGAARRPSWSCSLDKHRSCRTEDQHLDQALAEASLLGQVWTPAPGPCEKGHEHTEGNVHEPVEHRKDIATIPATDVGVKVGPELQDCASQGHERVPRRDAQNLSAA